MAFNENTRVKIPAILHLCRLGYSYISLSTARWDLNTNIFTDIFSASIKKINPDIEEGEVKRTFEDVSLALDNEDLGEAFSKMLLATSGIRLIDFSSPENFSKNNSFHVVTELTYKNGDDEFRPDITLLINGMPLAFIEVKKPSENFSNMWFNKFLSRISKRLANSQYSIQTNFLNIKQETLLEILNKKIKNVV